MNRPYKSPKAKGWKKHSAAPEMFLQLQFASDHGKIVDPSDIPAADIAIGNFPEEDLPSNKYMTHVEVKQCDHVIEEIEQETTIAAESFHLQLNIPQPVTDIPSAPEAPIASTSSSAGILEVVCATPKMIPKPKVDPLHEDEEGPEKPTEEEMGKLLTTMSSHLQPMPPPPAPPLDEQVSLASRSSFVGSDAGSISEKSVSSSSTASMKRMMSSPKSVLDIQPEDRTNEKPSRRSSRNISSKYSPSQKRRSSHQLTSEPVLQVELTAEEDEQIISASMRSLPSDLKGYRDSDEKALRRGLRIPSKASVSSPSSSPANTNLRRRRSVQGPVSDVAPPPSSPRNSRRRSSVKAMPTISSSNARSDRKKGLSQSEHVTKSSRSEQKRNSSSSVASSSGRRDSYLSSTPRTRGRRSVDSLELGKTLKDACPATDGGAPITMKTKRDSTSSRRLRRTLDVSSPGKSSSRRSFQSARELPFVADLNSDDDDEAAVRVLDALLQ